MERFKIVKKASLLGIIGNIFLLIIKSIVAIVSNSQAMLADSFNSAGDIFSSFMTFIGNKIASKPGDDDHNLGHGKAEYIYSLLISIIMMLTCLIVFKNSAESIIYKEKYEFSVWLVVVCITTIIIKFLLFLYTNKISKNQNNLLIEANSKDHRNDCIITTMNLISCLLTLNGIYLVDGIVGMIIATCIFISSFKIFIQSYDVLMDKAVSNETKERVYAIIKRHSEVKDILHFNSTPIGYKYQISFTISVDGNMSTFDSHKIADDLEKEISQEIEEIYLTVIHVNPVNTKNI